MQRRDLLRTLGAAALGSLLAPLSPEERLALGRRLHARLAPRAELRLLDREQAALVTALADTLLPRDDTPGALDAGAVEFYDLLLAEWHTFEEREAHLAGLRDLDARCRAATGTGYAAASPESRAAFLATVDGSEGPAGSAEAAWARLRAVTIFAWSTSQPILEGPFKSPLIPGRFDGCIELSGAPS